MRPFSASLGRATLPGGMVSTRTSRTVVLAIVASLFTIAACGAARSTATPDPREVRISAQQAIDAVKAFVPQASDLAVEGPSDSVLHRFYQLQNAEMSAAVDAFDGHVMGLLLVRSTPTGNDVVLTPEQAQARASAYLTDHHVPFDELRASVKLTGHGDFSEYDVTWQGYSGEVVVPDQRSASVDPSNGTVFAFSDFHLPYAPTVESEQLKVAFAHDGAQILVWEFGLSADSGQGYVGHALVQVDALTGAATVIGRG